MTNSSPAANVAPKPKNPSPRLTSPPTKKAAHPTSLSSGDISERATGTTTPNAYSPAPTSAPTTELAEPIHDPSGPNFARGHTEPDAHSRLAASVLPPDHGNADAHERASGAPSPDDTALLILADALDDLEKCRISTTNRLGALEREGWPMFSDGGRLLALSQSLIALEKQCAGELKRAMREHPLGAWVDATIGVGEQQAARLLAAIGDPADRPNVAKLWAYCGLHVIDGQRPQRRKGQKANWSTIAKTRAMLIAYSCMKNSESPYRAVYDQAREAAKSKVHLHQCQNSKRPPKTPNGCGTQAHPEWGAPGSPWRPGHQHRYALGIVAKEILKDLWVEARRIQT